MKTILVSTDFSDAANNAVNYAVEIAKYFNANLILLNAAPIPTTSYENLISPEIVRGLQEASKEGLDNMKDRILEKNKSLNIKCLSETGFAYDLILSASEKYHADLIVMGIVGEAGRIKEHVIGSTTVKVAKNSLIPVFIIPEGVKYSRIHKISFACDLEKTEGSSVIYITKYFTKIFDAELEILNIEHPREECTAERAANNLFLERQLQNTKHKTVFITGTHVAKDLEDYFMHHPTDDVKLHPKKHSVFHNLFNESVTKELAFHLHYPILTITG